MRAKKKIATAYPAHLIETTGKIVAPIENGAYRASLPNGKLTVVYMPKRVGQQLGALQSGDKVLLALNPSSFDYARITMRLPE